MTRTNRTPLQRAAMGHNALIGQAVAIQKNAARIEEAATSSAVAKSYARECILVARNLEKALRLERKDP